MINLLNQIVTKNVAEAAELGSDELNARQDQIA
jgi:hypothetical protein